MISMTQYKEMCLDSQTECQCDDNNFYTFGDNVAVVQAPTDRLSSRQGNSGNRNREGTFGASSDHATLFAIVALTMLTVLCIVMLVICCKIQQMKLDQSRRQPRFSEPGEGRSDTEESGNRRQENKRRGEAHSDYESRESNSVLNPLASGQRNQKEVADSWKNNGNAAGGWQLPKSAQDDVNYSDFLPDVYVSNPVPATATMPGATAQGPTSQGL